MPHIEMLEQLMPALQNIGMQTHYFVSQFFTMLQGINGEHRKYMEKLNAGANKFPQMPYMPVMPDMQENEVKNGMVNPVAGYMPMLASLFMPSEK